MLSVLRIFLQLSGVGSAIYMACNLEKYKVVGLWHVTSLGDYSLWLIFVPFVLLGIMFLFKVVSELVKSLVLSVYTLLAVRVFFIELTGGDNVLSRFGLNIQREWSLSEKREYVVQYLAQKKQEYPQIFSNNLITDFDGELLALKSSTMSGLKTGCNEFFQLKLIEYQQLVENTKLLEAAQSAKSNYGSSMFSSALNVILDHPYIIGGGIALIAFGFIFYYLGSSPDVVGNLGIVKTKMGDVDEQALAQVNWISTLQSKVATDLNAVKQAVFQDVAVLAEQVKLQQEAIKHLTKDQEDLRGSIILLSDAFNGFALFAKQFTKFDGVNLGLFKNLSNLDEDILVQGLSALTDIDIKVLSSNVDLLLKKVGLLEVIATGHNDDIAKTAGSVKALYGFMGFKQN